MYAISQEVPLPTRTKLSDVARLAGVSTATVSRVLNQSTQVNPELVSRVNDALAALNYRRNGLARGLRRQQNTVVGAVIPDVSNPFFTEVVRGVEDELRKKGYLLVLCNTDDDPDKERAYLQLLVDQQAAGIIIAPTADVTDEIRWAREGGMPVVAIDRALSGGFDSVVLSNVEAARDLTSILLEHEDKVAHISGPLRTATASERAEGYRQALARGGRLYDPSLLVEADYTEAGGYRAMSQLMSQPMPPSGVFVGNNVMSLGALRLLAEDARTVTVASFDPLPWNALSSTEVVALDHPSRQMGVTAAQLLLDRLTLDDAPAREIVLDGGTPVWQVRA